jgi:hypothetical protein
LSNHSGRIVSCSHIPRANPIGQTLSRSKRSLQEAQRLVILKRVAIALYVIGLLIAAGLSIERAAREQLLVPLALPVVGVLILATRVLRPRAEFVCWAVFTAWLWSTHRRRWVALRRAAPYASDAKTVALAAQARDHT